jgi:hypothetical protein
MPETPDPSVRPTPCAAQPRLPPGHHRPGTCGRCCRPSSAAENSRAAGSAGAAGAQQYRIAFIAARMSVLRGRPPGLADGIIWLRHPVGRSESLHAPAGKSGAVPPSTSLSATRGESITGRSCHPPRWHELLGHALIHNCQPQPENYRMWRLKIYKSADAIILIISAPHSHITKIHIMRYPVILVL